MASEVERYFRFPTKRVLGFSGSLFFGGLLFSSSRIVSVGSYREGAESSAERTLASRLEFFCVRAEQILRTSSLGHSEDDSVLAGFGLYILY